MIEDKLPRKTYRRWNPVIVGGAVGLVAALIVVLTQVAHTPTPDNPALSNPFSAFGIGALWGAAIASFRNWLNERHR